MVTYRYPPPTLRLRLRPNSRLLRVMAIYSTLLVVPPFMHMGYWTFSFSTDSVLPNVTDPPRHHLEARSQQPVSLVG